ncbi:MAG: glycosyltransferase family 2 protein [Fimbriimonas sp.]
MNVRPVLSVVVPCYNEQEVIQTTHARLSEVLPTIEASYELLYVDDGSRDNTIGLLRDIERADPRVRVLTFSRNFGHQAAVTAGVQHARGDAVVLIDADLQDPPEIIREMVAKWHEGYHVVYGVRRTREGETPFKLATARAFYRMLNKLSEVAIPLDTGDFRLMDRCVVDQLNAMPERDRFIRGMVSWIGFRQTKVEYDRARRFAGESKYPLRKMLKFAIDGILSFSDKPLRLAANLGFLVSAFSALLIFYALYKRFFTSDWVSGWTFLFIMTVFLGGIQLICLGIIGEYVGRIYGETKGRPLYILDETYRPVREPEDKKVGIEG